MGNKLLKITEAGERETNRQCGRPRGRSWREFVWQQQAEEPQGHANERNSFQRRGGGLLEWGLLTDSAVHRGGAWVGEGCLRGQGSELSGDPTTTNARLSSP